MMGKRSWASPSAQTAKWGTSGWAWLKCYTSLPDAQRADTRLTAAWVTRLLPPMTIVYNVESEESYFIFEPVRYGAPALHINWIDVPDKPKLFYFNFERGATFLHVTNPMEWLAIPTRPVGPKRLFEEYTGHEVKGIAFQQVEAAMPVAKWRLLKTKHNLTLTELCETALAFGIEASGLRPVLLQRICEFLCQDDTELYRAWFQAQVLARDLKTECTKNFSDITEDAFNELDHDDQEEFQDTKDP